MACSQRCGPHVYKRSRREAGQCSIAGAQGRGRPGCGQVHGPLSADPQAGRSQELPGLVPLLTGMMETGGSCHRTVTESFRVTADPRFGTGGRGRVFPSLSLRPDVLANGEGLHGTGSHFRCHGTRRTETPDEVSGDEKAGKWHGSLGSGARPARRAQPRAGDAAQGAGRAAEAAPREGSPCSPQRSPAWPCFHTTASYVGHRSERPDRCFESSLRWTRVREVGADLRRHKHASPTGHLSHVP